MNQYDENDRNDLPAPETEVLTRRSAAKTEPAEAGEKYQGRFFRFMRKLTDPRYLRKKRNPKESDYPEGKAPLWVTDPDRYEKKRPLGIRILCGFGHFALHMFLICGMIGVVALGIGAAVVYSFSDLELDERFASMDLDYSSFIYSVNPATGENEIYQEIQSSSGGRRVWVSDAEIPQHVKNALVAVEDKRFYTHIGVDPIRTANAVIEYAVSIVTGSSSRASGGSTLTQQVIKNMTGDDEYGIKRKVKEMLQALYIERRYDKDQILEYYLNVVYFGNSANGISAAADIYFDKDVGELTVTEAAAIIAITKAPSAYDPIRHPERHLERRNTILWMMCEQGYITRDEYDAYSKEVLTYAIGSDSSGSQKEDDDTFLYDYYTDMVIRDVLEDLQAAGYSSSEAKRLLYRGGLQIYACVDTDIQNMMESYFTDESNFEYKGSSKDVIVNKDGEEEIPQVAMMVMDPDTGAVLGVIGGRGEKTTSLDLNRATDTVRQPGSSIKPLSIYGYAIENGLMTLGMPIDDVPAETRKDGYTWPSNYNGRYNGLVSMKKALSWSLNCPAAYGLKMVGVETSYDFLVNSLHLTSLVAADKVSLAPLSVGALTHGVTLREMTTAYTVFAGDGTYTKYRSYSKVVGYDGKTILDNSPQREEVFSEQTAFLITDVLEAALDTGGTSDVAKLDGVDTAGKSGTTSFYKDRWFIGYTPEYLAGIWWGYDTPNTLENTHQILMWNEVLTKIYNMKGIHEKEFEVPSGVSKVSVCWKSGMLPGPFCAEDGCVQSFYYTEETKPTKTCNVHHQLYVCTESGKIAHTGCPSVTLKTFVDLDRSFKCTVTVRDAATICPKLNERSVLYVSDTLPAYSNMVPDGQFPSVYSTKTNCICTAHAPAEKPLYQATPPVTDPPSTDTSESTGTGTTTDTGTPVDTSSSSSSSGGTQDNGTQQDQ